MNKEKVSILSITFQYSEERRSLFRGATYEDITTIRFPRGFDIYKPPIFRMTDEIQLSVKRAQGEILKQYFDTN